MVKYWPVVALSLGLGVLGYVAGRYVQPAKIITKDKVVERVVYRESSGAASVSSTKAAEDRDTDRETRTERFPDGRVVTVDHYIYRTKTVTVAAQAKVEYRTVVQERVKVEEHEKIVTNRPDWILGANAGLPLLGGRNILPGPAVIGASIERRLFGGVYAGINATSNGVVGVGVRVTF